MSDAKPRQGRQTLAGPPAGRRIELPVTALRGAGDLARRAGTHAGACALKRPGTPDGQQSCHRAAHGLRRGTS
jgi:hypothetical protein